MRAHLDEVAGRVELPGPEADASPGAWADDGGPAARDRLRPTSSLLAGSAARPLLAAAASVAVVALVAGVALARRDDGHDVSTDPTPPPTHDDRARRRPPRRRPPRRRPTRRRPPASRLPPPGSVPTGPIVGPNGILGSWDGRPGWSGTSDDPAPPDQEYQVVTLGERVAPWSGPEAVDWTPRRSTLPSTSGFDYGYGTVTWPARLAVAHGAADGPAAAGRGRSTRRRSSTGRPPPRSRPILGVADDARPEVRQVVRADLDGDGTAEVLVVADRGAIESRMVDRPGDWAVLFHAASGRRWYRDRRSSGGTHAGRVDLDASVPPAVRATRSRLADLNGDGRLEVVVNLTLLRGLETTIYDVDSQGGFPWSCRQGAGSDPLPVSPTGGRRRPSGPARP